jgi:hypothetical protein
MLSERKIYHLVKTDHFLYRQWDRKIDDSTLRYLALRMKRKLEKTKGNVTVIVSSEMMKQLKERELAPRSTGRKFNLVIGLCRNRLITLYYSKDISSIFLRGNKGRKVLIL